MNIQAYDIVNMFYSITCFIYMYGNMSTIIQWVVSFYKKSQIIHGNWHINNKDFLKFIFLQKID